MRTKLDAIEARTAAASDCGHDPDDWCEHLTELVVQRSAVPFIAAARTDLPLLLAVARAARLVKAQCDDMCPSWYDEPCDCGMAALRAALAPLLEPEG